MGRVGAGDRLFKVSQGGKERLSYWSTCGLWLQRATAMQTAAIGIAGCACGLWLQRATAMQTAAIGIAGCACGLWLQRATAMQDDCSQH
jgi:hypothetical protein